MMFLAAVIGRVYGAALVTPSAFLGLKYSENAPNFDLETVFTENVDL